MASLSELEQFIAGGFFKEGTAMGFRNLDEYLLTVVNQQITKILVIPYTTPLRRLASVAAKMSEG